MNNHPINLAVRFALEIVLLIIFSCWGWSKFNGFNKSLLGIGLPLLVAVIWAVFRVKGDPGKAIVAIPGWLRLLFEIIVFVSGAYLLFQLQMNKWAYLFIIVSLLHYIISYDRTVWLFKN